MLVTAIFLIIDWLVLYTNDYVLVAWHCLYIGALVLLLWSHSQPKHYDLSASSSSKLKQDTPLRECAICHKPKPARYYHCRRCSKCIFMMDHHCEWVGNCIGRYNNKLYLHLLINVFVHCLIIACLILYNYDSVLNSTLNVIYFSLASLLDLYAIYQSYRLVNDFICSLKNNQTLIETYKKVRGNKQDLMTALRRNLGQNYLTWPLPFFTQNDCDLLEETSPLSNQTIKEHDYADEYIDGTDSDDDLDPPPS